MNRKQKIIVSITSIFIVLLALVGLTYAYFLTRITGNSNDKSISITTADLSVTWIDGSNILLNGDAIVPGKFMSTMDFKVENTGDRDAEYEVVLKDYRVKWDKTVSNTNQIEGVDTYLNHPEDMEMVITCKSYETRSDGEYTNAEESGSCSGRNGMLPTTNDSLIYNEIEEGKTHVYEITLTYVDDGTDQSDDMNKTIEGLVDIRVPQESGDIEGYVTNYQAGDYVETNSITRISSINKDGYFKILSLEFDNHTISLKNKENEEQGNQSITLIKGTKEKITGSNITLTNEKRVLNVDIDRSSKTYTVKEIKNGNQHTNGTLALNFKSGYNINFISNKIVEDVDIKEEAIEYPFTIENIGNTHQNITIKLTDIEIDESLKHVDFRYGLYNAKTGNGLSFGIFKYSESEELIYTNTVIDAGDETTNKDYILRIWIHNNGTSQKELLNKEFSAKISVTGEAVNYTPESCFDFDETTGSITGYHFDNQSCPKSMVIPKTINEVEVVEVKELYPEPIYDGMTAEKYLLNNIIIPNTIKHFKGTIGCSSGAAVFGNNMVFPEGINIIDGQIYCVILDKLILPDTVTTTTAFTDNSLRTIVIPYGSFSYSNYQPDFNVVLMNGTTELDMWVNMYITEIEIPSSLRKFTLYRNSIGNSIKVIVRDKTKEEAIETFGSNWDCLDYRTYDNTCIGGYLDVVYR